MARKGEKNPKTKIKKFIANGKTPRAQFIKAPSDGEKYGEQCKQAEESSRPGCKRCKYHGGRAGGPSTTGEHSKYTPLPKNLRARFEAAVVDPEILNLTKKIALLDSQIWAICDEAQNQENFDMVQTKKILTLTSQHRKLVAQETDRRIAMGSMLDVQQLMMIIGYIYDGIQKIVSNQSERREL